MNSPLAYSGDKSRLSEKIVARIPKDHVCYCEPFSGAAWVFFRKEPSKVEVINDLDGELVNFWRVVQNHLQPFMDYFKWAVISRKLWLLENRKDPATLTDLQRASRYYYLQRLGFAGKTADRTFGLSASRPMNLNLTTMEETLLEVHWRMERATIENLDGCLCIERYDRPDTFFYIDPPYYDMSQCYAHKFLEEDFMRLEKTLRKIKGRFLLSLNDHADVRKRFKGFHQDKVTLIYSSGNSRVDNKTRSRPRHELFIHNLD